MKISTLITGPTHTNTYILQSADGFAAVVDPGGSTDELLARIASRGLKLVQILLTHAHFDHILGLEELRERTGAPCALHTDDRIMLENPNFSMMKQFAGIDTPCTPPERLLRDGDEIALGCETLKVLHTPGHTPGSVCFDVGDFIVCGDTIFRENIGRYDFWGGDYDTIMESLQRLAALPGNPKLYPGHGQSTTLEHEREFNLYLK